MVHPSQTEIFFVLREERSGAGLIHAQGSRWRSWRAAALGAGARFLFFQKSRALRLRTIALVGEAVCELPAPAFQEQERSTANA
jgi:hypothetical protein